MEPHLIKFRPEKWVEVITAAHEMHMSKAAFVRRAVNKELECRAEMKANIETLEEGRI